jgi:hypothetical protein
MPMAKSDSDLRKESPLALHSSSQFPTQTVCPMCTMPVQLETAKTDEHGRAIHEECYLRALKLNDGSLQAGTRHDDNN